MIDVLYQLEADISLHIKSLSDDDGETFESEGALSQGCTNFDYSEATEAVREGNLILYRSRVISESHIQLLMDFLESHISKPVIMRVGNNTGLLLNKEEVTDEEGVKTIRTRQIDGVDMTNPYPTKSKLQGLLKPEKTQFNTLGFIRSE